MARIVDFTDLASVMLDLTNRIKSDLRKRIIDGEFVKDVAEGVARRAKSKLGTYQSGWRPLKQATKDRRAARGSTPNDPLLEEGELRESIRTRIIRRQNGTDGYIGSNAPQARIQELGGISGNPPISIPARPYLAPALVELESEIVHKVEVELEDCVEGAIGRAGGYFGELP